MNTSIFTFLLIGASALSFVGCNGDTPAPTVDSDSRILYPSASTAAIFPVSTSNVAGVPISFAHELTFRTRYSPLQPILFRADDCTIYSPMDEIAKSVSRTDIVLNDDNGRVPYFVQQSEDPAACVLYPMRLMQRVVDISIDNDSQTFEVASAAERATPMLAVANATRKWLSNNQVQYELNEVAADHYTRDDDSTLVAYTGTFTVPNYLQDQRIDWINGIPQQAGVAEEFFHIYVPTSITSTTIVPIVQYGHGLFGDPAEVWYGSQTNIRNETAGIFGAIAWGMSVRYFGKAAGALWDLSDLGLLQDRNIQSIANALVFGRILRDKIAPEIAASYNVTSSTHLDYVGISQGGILGSPLLASSTDIRRAVLHVGGGSWTPMMTNSSNWNSSAGTGYGDIVRTLIPSDPDRALLYAAWQSIWDWWDPAIFAPFWLTTPDGTQLHADRKVYYPYSIDDPQVPNFSSDLVLRGTSASLVGTPIYEPLGISSIGFAAAEPQGIVASQWDVGSVDAAHGEVRKLPAFAQQVSTFVRTGQLIDTCNGTACIFSPSND